MRKKKILTLTVDKMKLGGKSENNTSYDRKVILNGGITGQKIEAVIYKQNKSSAKAKILKMLEKSPIETEKVCKNFGKCGGCSMLSIPYDKQIEIKKDMLIDMFLSKGHEEFADINVIKSPIDKGYKNKMEFSFGDEVKGGPMTLGLHPKNSYMSVVTTDDCHIIDDDYKMILKKSLEYFTDLKIPHYNSKDHKGYLRHLVVRKGANTGQILINIVTSSQADFAVDVKTLYQNYASTMLSLKLQGKITGIIHSTNDSLSDNVKSDTITILYGKEYFYDIVLGKKFKISPYSFFQTNTLGADVLYKTAIDMIEGSIKKAFDLYSGTGTIGITLSERCEKVYCIEIVEEAVKMAIENAKANKVENVEFILGDVKEKVSKISDNPHLIVLDPPRSGITEKALIDIINFNPEHILYISCNPIKLADDLIILKENNYKVTKKSAVDMFPNTNHIECVVLMSKVQK